MEFPDIKYNISSHSWQLFLKKHCRKNALNCMFSSIFSVKNMGFHQDIYEVRDGFDTFSWSSRMSRGLPVGHKSLPSIILIQEGSEDFSFSAFYCVKWRIPSDLCAGRYTDWYTGKYKMRSRRRRLGPQRRETEWWRASRLHLVRRFQSLTISLRVWSVSDLF